MRSLKKKFSHTLNAFTLPELVVSMLLMAILFGVIATMYMIITRQSRRNFETNRFFTEYFTTKKIMQNDMEKATGVTAETDPERIIIQIKASNGTLETISYQVDSNYILRNIGVRTDTLKPGGRITNRTIVNDTLPLITGIRLQHRYKGQLFYTYLQKKYATDDLLNYDNSNISINESTY
ncbi:hypothetical protein A8C56_02685 [Niabella ginsenosidivorans]|uniref:Prepilin-type N-terminal cleavage/methylation domain-containing protein n=1 Tax=Niabella ginsenosidivorans TaxID=1176587 RepID=A0A1A9HZX3_9BACT|nr:prepilin-type N-terminal cleavage/methylation domain-containing protein [Niabella ginsenosidivorans]ANH80030.1 hypothetical protein A8C56_02685 [Niabella ginsenosidivorans]